MDTQEIHSHWITSSGTEGSTGSGEALFPYWSFTKTVIAICALKLRDAGATELDVPIAGNPHTLRQLLTHTTGLPDYCHLPEYGQAVSANEVPWSREKMLGVALADGMLFEPAQGWSYSNIGYMFVREQIEAITGQSLGDVISETVCKPLGLDSVELAQTREQFEGLHWKSVARYDPLWVYHGCLFGTAGDAARLLHSLFAGELLCADTLAQMLETKPLGGPLAGRPWADCGYAVGLMAGSVDGVGRLFGHSGGGPFSVNAVYHFPDTKDPITVASFTDGTTEGVAEFAATKLAPTKGAR
ncbi:serine hydrolase domain-containing protein [Pseudovibrio axinellae]|nr:serine hydrolase domain-containing protein [Pseudovibrio axinellae]